MHRLAFCAALLTSTAAAAQAVQISDGWVHAVPPFQTEATGYLKLRSDKNDQLTGITIDTGGTATLDKVEPATAGNKGDEGLPLPAGKTVTLSPGGDHLVLVGRDAPLLPGDRVGVTLYFKHAAPETVVLNVLSRGNSSN
jgi:copper(I)-binding protein